MVVKIEFNGRGRESLNEISAIVTVNEQPRKILSPPSLLRASHSAFSVWQNHNVHRRLHGYPKQLLQNHPPHRNKSAAWKRAAFEQKHSGNSKTLSLRRRQTMHIPPQQQAKSVLTAPCPPSMRFRTSATQQCKAKKTPYPAQHASSRNTSNTTSAK